MSKQKRRPALNLPDKIPKSLYQVLYDQCGGFVDCDADPQAIWDAFKKYIREKIEP